MSNRARSRRTAMVIAAAAGCLVIAGCGTARAPLTDEETTSLGPAKCPGGELRGAGSSAQHNAIDQVGETYSERCDRGASVKYEASGSAAGIAAFLAGTIDWAGSETPLTEAQQNAAASRCTGGEAWSLPLVAGPVSIAFNLTGVEHLTLSAPVLGEVFQGRITRWNDPAIATLNPDVTLPDAPINVVARDDAHGLTEGLTRYLADHGAWPSDRVGNQWSGAGVTLSRADALSALRGTANSIGYVENSAALDNSLPIARLDSGAGPVELTPQSAAAGLATARISGEDGDLRLTPVYADAPAGAYPLQIVSYEVICTTGLTPSSKIMLLKDFLGFLASDQQQAALGEVGYTPLPDAVREPVRDAISKIR